MTGTSLVVQWLRLCASNAGRVGLIPGWGARLSHTMRCGQKIKSWGWHRNKSREISLEALDAVWGGGSGSKYVILRLSSKETIFSSFYWSIVDLQRCVSFRYIAKWFSYTHTHNKKPLEKAFFSRAFSLIVKVKVAQSCATLCNPMYCSPPGSSIHGILQARILEWVAISFSRGFSSPRDPTQVSHIAGGFFTIWAIREALFPYRLLPNTDYSSLCYTVSPYCLCYIQQWVYAYPFLPLVSMFAFYCLWA